MLPLVVGEPISILDAASASAAPEGAGTTINSPSDFPAPGVFSKSPLSASDVTPNRFIVSSTIAICLVAALFANSSSTCSGLTSTPVARRNTAAKKRFSSGLAYHQLPSAKVAPYRLSSCALSFWR